MAYYRSLIKSDANVYGTNGLEEGSAKRVLGENEKKAQIRLILKIDRPG